MARGIPPTVGNFFLVLSSLVTQYDQKESAREAKRYGRANIYRLGHLLKAVQESEDEVLRQVGKGDQMTAEIASIVVQAMENNFTVNPKADNFDLAPARAFVRQLEAFLVKGKNPSLVG